MKNDQSKNGGLIQFLKFAIVGVVNTGVDWVVFYLLIHLVTNIDHSTAKAISFILALLNSYIWNTIWTFKNEYQKTSISKSAIFAKFVVVSLVGWGINVYVFSLVSNNLNTIIINKDFLPLVSASASAIIWNFFGNKFWTYKK